MIFRSPGMVTCFDDDQDREAFYTHVVGELTEVSPHLGESISQYVNDTGMGSFNFNAWKTLQEKTVECCLGRTDTSMLQYMGTAATVRDLAAMADAFDGPGSKINFWGIGTGSLVGSYLLKRECRMTMAVHERG